ncbi:HAD-like domain-containing protein [Phakopsora pachyrhizi]|uniref:HAD-like domain-containing protein n=1 Tax=Phakopsora pachyrhizi TaxID=170000 RepID=A0AAV0ANJ4_PHAPC|nr:HAD-like domain-containing protein [Phakopsora pachyrhizi]CAH7669102.1 HAD-like domain-containing protein [Phakopsora pachyrhizi]
MSEFNLCNSFSERNQAELIVDAILFDMDGTLVDSIAALESAWGAVAIALNRDPQEVIDAAHGKRAIDHLKDLKPHLRGMSNAEMVPHVEEFETEILNQADHFQNEVRSRRLISASSKRQSNPTKPTRLDQSLTARKVTENSAISTGCSYALDTTSLTQAPVGSSEENIDRGNGHNARSQKVDEVVYEGDSIKTDEEEVDVSDLIDKSIKILPGVKRLIDSLPADRYAVATSAAKTYCHGALKRVGIVPPKVTITADDPRLKNGKPFPDPFILAAECLGFDPKNCAVFEDSPLGIKAGVASGAKTVAVCTSHPCEKISNSGAHWLIPTLDLVQVEVRDSDGKLRIYVDATKENVEDAHMAAVQSNAPPSLVHINEK